jgi:hypothetical protein
MIVLNITSNTATITKKILPSLCIRITVVLFRNYQVLKLV